tara:strand:- start:1338 stop:1745 length:408 start_codon:yes stop_codon:yes gene_type:complete
MFGFINLKNSKLNYKSFILSTFMILTSCIDLGSPTIETTSNTNFKENKKPKERKEIFLNLLPAKKINISHRLYEKIDFDQVSISSGNNQKIILTREELFELKDGKISIMPNKGNQYSITLLKNGKEIQTKIIQTK